MKEKDFSIKIKWVKKDWYYNIKANGTYVKWKDGRKVKAQLDEKDWIEAHIRWRETHVLTIDY